MIKIEDTVAGDKYEFDKCVFAGIDLDGIRVGGYSPSPGADIMMLVAVYATVKGRVCGHTGISAEDFDKAVLSGLADLKERE